VFPRDLPDEPFSGDVDARLALQSSMMYGGGPRIKRGEGNLEVVQETLPDRLGFANEKFLKTARTLRNVLVSITRD
jgi:hypothetical protein